MYLFVRVARVVTCVFLLCLLTASFACAGHGGPKIPKKGILLVSFGTTVPEARVALENIDRKVKAAFPGVEIRWAYSAAQIRRKLAKTGMLIDSPSTALSRMADDGFTDVAVQSLHTIPGHEYHGLMRTVHAFEGIPKGLVHVALGDPLLSAPESLDQVADALLKAVPAKRTKDEAVVFMGHGTDHPAGVFYPAMQYTLARKDPNVLMGTVEGIPSYDDVVRELAARGVKKVYLMPFMSVAGDHARNDMAGDDPDSWMSMLTKAGYTCVPVLHGTAEFDHIVQIWIDHLKSAYAQLQ